MTATAVETCRIAWWTGHVQGRFVAMVDGAPPSLAGEAHFRRLGDAEPAPTPEAVAALDWLVEQLGEQGWTLADEPGGAWYERVLTRPASHPPDAPADPIVVDGASAAPAASSQPAAPARPAPHRDDDLVDGLRDELRRAKAAVEHERQARLEAEAESEAAPPVERPPEPPRRRSPLLLAAYAAAVVLAAAVFAVGFGSAYAAAVAGLAVAAVCLGVDSVLVARRR